MITKTKPEVKTIFALCFIFIGALIVSCKHKVTKPVESDTFNTGKVPVVADASFEPILNQEQYIFEALNPEAHLKIAYKTENEAINMLLSKKILAAVLARDLDTAERGSLLRANLNVEANLFAIDAVTLIVNKQSADTTMTVDELKRTLNGEANTDKSIVFDNPNSSLVRYLKDFSGNQTLKQKNIYALKSNKDVIKYVSEHNNAIGIIGFGWLNNPEKDYPAYVDNINVVGVRDEGSKKYPEGYFKPSQETLVLKQYPLSRSLYIINCTSKVGLVTGFATFLSSERGQRIILKSGLLPDSLPTRQINLNNKYNSR